MLKIAFCWEQHYFERKNQNGNKETALEMYENPDIKVQPKLTIFSCCNKVSPLWLEKARFSPLVMLIAKFPL